MVLPLRHSLGRACWLSEPSKTQRRLADPSRTGLLRQMRWLVSWSLKVWYGLLVCQSERFQAALRRSERATTFEDVVSQWSVGRGQSRPSYAIDGRVLSDGNMNGMRLRVCQVSMVLMVILTLGKVAYAFVIVRACMGYGCSLVGAHGEGVLPVMKVGAGGLRNLLEC